MVTSPQMLAAARLLQEQRTTPRGVRLGPVSAQRVAQQGGAPPRTNWQAGIDKLHGREPGDDGGRGLYGALFNNPITKAVTAPLQVLDIPRRIVMSSIQEAADALNGGDASFSDFMSQVKDPTFGFGDIVPHTGNKWLDRFVGLAGDIAFDPLTYLTLGASKIPGATGRAALVKAGEEAGLAEDVLRQVGRYGGNVVRDEATRKALGLKPRIGLEFAGRHIPKTENLTAALQKVVNVVKEPVLDTGFAKGVRKATGVSRFGPTRAAYEDIVTGKGSPGLASRFVKAFEAREAAERLTTEGTFGQKVIDLGNKLGDNAGFTDALERHDLSTPELVQWKRYNDELLAYMTGKGQLAKESGWLGKGVSIGERENWAPHIPTAEGKPLLEIPEAKGRGLGLIASDPQHTRRIVPGVDKNGRPLSYIIGGKEFTPVTGTIREINEWALRNGLPKLYEDSPQKLIARAAEDAGKAVGVARYYQELEKPGVYRAAGLESDPYFTELAINAPKARQLHGQLLGRAKDIELKRIKSVFEQTKGLDDETKKVLNAALSEAKKAGTLAEMWDSVGKKFKPLREAVEKKIASTEKKFKAAQEKVDKLEGRTGQALAEGYAEAAANRDAALAELNHLRDVRRVRDNLMSQLSHARGDVRTFEDRMAQIRQDLIGVEPLTPETAAMQMRQEAVAGLKENEPLNWLPPPGTDLEARMSAGEPGIAARREAEAAAAAGRPEGRIRTEAEQDQFNIGVGHLRRNADQIVMWSKELDPVQIRSRTNVIEQDRAVLEEALRRRATVEQNLGLAPNDPSGLSIEERWSRLAEDQQEEMQLWDRKVEEARNIYDEAVRRHEYPAKEIARLRAENQQIQEMLATIGRAPLTESTRQAREVQTLEGRLEALTRESAVPPAAAQPPPPFGGSAEAEIASRLANEMQAARPEMAFPEVPPLPGDTLAMERLRMMIEDATSTAPREPGPLAPYATVPPHTPGLAGRPPTAPLEDVPLFGGSADALLATLASGPATEETLLRQMVDERNFQRAFPSFTETDPNRAAKMEQLAQQLQAVESRDIPAELARQAELERPQYEAWLARQPRPTPPSGPQGAPQFIEDLMAQNRLRPELEPGFQRTTAAPTEPQQVLSARDRYEQNRLTELDKVREDLRQARGRLQGSGVREQGGESQVIAIRDLLERERQLSIPYEQRVAELEQELEAARRGPVDVRGKPLEQRLAREQEALTEARKVENVRPESEVTQLDTDIAELEQRLIAIDEQIAIPTKGQVTQQSRQVEAELAGREFGEAGSAKKSGLFHPVIFTRDASGKVHRQVYGRGFKNQQSAVSFAEKRIQALRDKAENALRRERGLPAKGAEAATREIRPVEITEAVGFKGRAPSKAQAEVHAAIQERKPPTKAELRAERKTVANELKAKRAQRDRIAPTEQARLDQIARRRQAAPKAIERNIEVIQRDLDALQRGEAVLPSEAATTLYRSLPMIPESQRTPLDIAMLGKPERIPGTAITEMKGGIAQMPIDEAEVARRIEATTREQELAGLEAGRARAEGRAAGFEERLGEARQEVESLGKARTPEDIQRTYRQERADVRADIAAQREPLVAAAEQRRQELIGFTNDLEKLNRDQHGAYDAVLPMFQAHTQQVKVAETAAAGTKKAREAATKDLAAAEKLKPEVKPKRAPRSEAALKLGKKARGRYKEAAPADLQARVTEFRGTLGKVTDPNTGSQVPRFLDPQTYQLLDAAEKVAKNMDTKFADQATADAFIASLGQNKVADMVIRVAKDGVSAAEDTPAIMGRSLYVRNEIKRMEASFENTYRRHQGQISKIVEAYTKFFKTYATATPGFHLRNAISATFMNLTEGTTPREMLDGVKIWREFRRNPTGNWKLALEPELRRHADQVIEAVYASGAGGRFSAEELAQRAYGGPAKAREKVIDNFATRFSRRRGEQVEGSVRAGLALHALKENAARGPLYEAQGFANAVARIKRVHFDYSDVNEIDQALRPYVPFWTFMSRNLPLQVQQMWFKPKAYAWYDSVRRNFAMGDEDTFLPDYLERQGAFPVSPGLALAPDIGPSQIENQLRMIQDPKQFLSNLNPIMKVPLEVATNRDFFYNTSYRPNDFQRVPNELLPLAAIARLLGGDQLVQSTPQGLVAETKFQNAARDLFPTLAVINRLGQTTESRQGKGMQYWLNFLGIPIKQVGTKLEREEIERERRRRRGLDPAEARRRALAEFGGTAA